MMTRLKARQILMAETLSAPSFFEFVLARKMGAKAIEQTTWIPVSERLPSNRKLVLVTAFWHETYQVMVGSCFDDEWWCVPWNNTGEPQQLLNVIAWMPLPEAYKKGEGD